MFLVKILNLFLAFLILASAYGLFFGQDSRVAYSQVAIENEILLKANEVLSNENIALELSIQGKQNNDAYAERFAREELNLIYPKEDFINLEDQKNEKPQP